MTSEPPSEYSQAAILVVYLGAGFMLGAALFGLLVVRSSIRCMIARQHLCQICAFGCGFVTLLFTLAKGYNAYSLYVWAYGIFLGGYHYLLKVTKTRNCLTLLS